MAQRKTKTKEINNSFDFILFITVMLLLALGITMVLSASSPSALATTGSSYTYVLKQLLSAAIGIVAMLILSKIDYKVYSKFYKIAYIASIGVLLLVLVPGLGRTVNGARRWINLPIVSSFQPSELTKIGLIVFFAYYLTKHKDDLKNIWKGFFKPLLILSPAILVLLGVQSHFSASVIIILVISVMMIVAGTRTSHFLSFGAIGATAGIGLMYILAKYFDIGGFRLTRITAFLDPWSDAQDSGWQIIQSLYAIGSGGIFGVGLRKQQTKVFIHIRTSQRLYICSTCRRIRICRLCCSYIIICSICLERNYNCHEGTRYVWKPFSNRYYCFNRTSSNDKYSSCYIFNASNRYGASIL